MGNNIGTAVAVGAETHSEFGNPKVDREGLNTLRLFEESVLDVVQHLFEELVEDSSRLRFDYSITPNSEQKLQYKANLTVFVPENEMGKVLGKQMKIFNAIKTLAFSIASKNGFFLLLMIQQTKPTH